MFDKYNKKVASFAILGVDNPNWRPDSQGYELWGTQAGIYFPVVKLLDYSARRSELEQNPNPFATVVLAHLDAQETSQNPGERKDRKFQFVKRLRQRGWSETQVRRLFRVIDWMMELPDPVAVAFWKQVKQYEEKEHMPFITTPERFGRIEGRAEALVKGLEAILRVRFRDAGIQLMSDIRKINDPERPEKILNAAETVAGPEELRKLCEAQ